MKNLVIITVLSLITVTQAFSEVRTQRGQRGEIPATRHGQHHGGGNGGGYYNGGGYNNGGRQYNRGTQKFRIMLHDHMRGQNTIKLKQEIKYQNPGVNFSNIEIVSVKLVAKSKHGQGQATFVVGNSQSYPETVGGNRFEFHQSAPYTFDKINFYNPSYGSQGKWQIKLKGNIKVKKVVVFYKYKNAPRRNHGQNGGRGRRSNY